jgi:hypothetical protein
MRLLMVSSLLATLLPLLAMLAWVVPVVAARWRRAHAAARVSLLALWLAGSALLLLRPHDDTFTGLDPMAYRQMTHALLSGRGLHDVDRVLAGVPEELRPALFFGSVARGRVTRDRAFELLDWRQANTAPFFLPTLPLAAGGLAPLLAPERLPPLVGALWLALLLAAGFAAGGGGGTLATAALVCGTAWPAWFLRGFYPEAAGAALVSGALAVAATRLPQGATMAGLTGFALGLAVTYHPTLLVLALPVALGLMVAQTRWRARALTAAGTMAGLLPCWATARWVCRPYGDWTSWRQLHALLGGVAELRAVGVALAALALLAGGAVLVCLAPRLRQRLHHLDAWATPWGWGALCVALVAAPLLLLPAAVGDPLRRAAAAVWSGLRWPYALLCLAGAGAILRGARPARERGWLALLCGASLFFLFVQGVERPMGVWSQRRFLPVVMTLAGLLAAPLAAVVSASAWRAWGLLPLALAAGAANLARWPEAFVLVNDRGAAAWTSSVAERLGDDRLVVFDYFPHSVPYAAGLRHRVLGLGEFAHARWPPVAAWIAGRAVAEEVWVATAWQPCPLEDGFAMTPIFEQTGIFPELRSKAFLPARGGSRLVEQRFMRARPLAPGEFPPQLKLLDGSPIGLRPPWGDARDSGGGRMARWTRQGSGIVGPVPPPGGRVSFEIECAFTGPTPDWTAQTLLIAPPWGGAPARLRVGPEWRTLETALERPATNNGLRATGVYRLSVERPYDPAAAGLPGYPSDLGVQARRLRLFVPDGDDSGLPVSGEP